MSKALGPVSDPQNRPRNRCSRLRAVRGWPETLSAVSAKSRFGAPVYAPRGVWKNDAMSCILGLLLKAQEPQKAAPKMAPYKAQELLQRAFKRQNPCLFTVCADDCV